MVPQLLLGLDNFRLEYLLVRIMSFYGFIAIKVGISSFMSELSYNVYADIYFSFYVKFRKKVCLILSSQKSCPYQVFRDMEEKYLMKEYFSFISYT